MEVMPTAHKAQKEQGYFRKFAFVVRQRFFFFGGGDKVYDFWLSKNLQWEFVTFYIFLLGSCKYSESSLAVT